MPEPRELRPYQSFDQSFRSRGPGDFRPEVVEVADGEVLTEDGFGGPPPPRATNLHPSMAQEPQRCVCGEADVQPGGWVQIDSTVHMATRPCYQAAETAQEPAAFDASASNPASPAPEVPEFSLDADAADLSELL